ncbi:MAG: YgiT-type zinc finger protein [Anaerolineae bacterium]|nr:YgiT-type zinc finger protein [Anaerolineae bacterium]
MLNKKEQPEDIVCDCCGKKGARHKLITRSYGTGETLLGIENIPVISCPNCGETYMTAFTSHELAREDCLAVRTQRGSKAKFRAAMSKVAKVEPIEDKDRL